ncbi:hypothetical protein HGRIS_007796 [Hohenbuehelia grisea]|uniref:Uncharacterized protein n=1 Tax=Hohenbuehelia grisea TaxID=104357 RepID=A0ABR3J639_9AGAR
MSDARPSMATSLSFSGSSSSSALSRPLKRRLTQDVDLFTPSATSFNPRPYTPPSASRDSSTKSSSSSRNRSGVGAQPLGMDPSPSDPDVLYLHPPFTSFPGSEDYPEGLSFALLSANPEWFLDARDYITEVANDNPDAIVYPSELEPPRGWCPAKKRDLKERGTDGWPEGEEPRLRCTFCRRTYAGVNAKSMWRRHVFERHKIAMANRRESSGKPRGRGCNKENRIMDSDKSGMQEAVVNFNCGPQARSPLRGASSKSKFRSVMPATSDSARRSSRSVPSAPRILQSEFPSSPDTSFFMRPHPLSQSILPPASPPLTPQPLHLVDDLDPPVHPMRLSSSPPPMHPIIPASPYNPLQTPSFKHSPPRLPSDQPWRFPSPSHPLHSKARELCLSMLAPDNGSPGIKRTPRGILSPISKLHKTPFRSPSLQSGRARMNMLETPESLVRLAQSSPSKLFSEKTLRLALHSALRPERMRHQVEESPLAKNSRNRLVLPKSLGTPSRNLLTPPSSDALDAKAILSDQDPFIAIWEPVTRLPHDRRTPPISSPEVDSPVVRRHTQLSASDAARVPLVGLGIGLLAPFKLPDDKSDFDDSHSEFEEYDLVYPTLADDEAEVQETLASSDASPPRKRRKTSNAAQALTFTTHI